MRSRRALAFFWAAASSSAEAPSGRRTRRWDASTVSPMRPSDGFSARMAAHAARSSSSVGSAMPSRTIASPDSNPRFSASRSRRKASAMHRAAKRSSAYCPATVQANGEGSSTKGSRGAHWRRKSTVPRFRLRVGSTTNRNRFFVATTVPSTVTAGSSPVLARSSSSFASSSASTRRNPAAPTASGARARRERRRARRFMARFWGLEVVVRRGILAETEFRNVKPM